MSEAGNIATSVLQRLSIEYEIKVTLVLSDLTLPEIDQAVAALHLALVKKFVIGK